MNLRRVILAGATAVAMIAAATLAVVAAGGGFGQAPGHYNFSDTNAFTFGTDSTGLETLNLSVDTGTFLFKPKGGGGFVRQEGMTVLSIDVELQTDPTLPGTSVANGCFIINSPNEFVVSTDLQTATLNATLNPSDSCFFGPLVLVLGATPVKEAGSGGGGNFGFSYPLNVAVTWTGTGAATSSTDQGTTTCQSFHAITHNTNVSASSASVSISLSGFENISTGIFGSVNIDQQSMQVTGTGVITPACGGPIGG